MDTHLKVVAVLHLVLGAIGLVCALIVMIVFGGAAGIVGASGDADAVAAVPIIGIAGTAVVSLLTIMALPSLVVGIGLWNHYGWARIAGIVLSILMLFGFPFATILGVYGLWVLFSRETQRLFNQTLRLDATSIGPTEGGSQSV
jgi:hypothetical protein